MDFSSSELSLQQTNIFATGAAGDSNIRSRLLSNDCELLIRPPSKVIHH